jgi:acyl carrier protein
MAYESTSPAVVLDDVRGVVANVLGVACSTVSQSSRLFELGADSFQLLDLTCRLESQFQIDLPGHFAVTGDYSVADLASVVTTRLHGRSGAGPPKPIQRPSKMMWL